MKAILTYHSIDTSGSPVSCDPESFERHLRFYSSGRVRVTTLTDLVSLPDEADAIAITFDDGFVNFGEYAAPRLLDRGLPVTAFVVTDNVGGTNAWGGSDERGIPQLPLLAWPQLRALSARGVDIGAHTRTHCDLATVEDDRIEDEVRGSADAIAQETGIRPDTFAYPYGRVNAAAAAVVGRNFRCGVTTEFRPLDGGSALPLLPRLDAFYFQRHVQLEAWGTQAFARFIERRYVLRRIRRAQSTISRRVLSLGAR